MFTLPIKAGWYHAILHGYKKEEYREIKPYYTIRFKKLFGCESMSEKDFIKLLDGSNNERFTTDVVLRNGYRDDCPSSKVKITLMAKEGEPEWGAEKGTLYYALSIKNIEEIVPLKGDERQ